MNVVQDTNELSAASAFNAQAPGFDQQYNSDLIIRYKRQRVYAHLLHYLQPNSRILELNAGTGEDAIFLAGLGHTVHATDISHVMQEKLQEKVTQHNLGNAITRELCSYTMLTSLKNKGPYDCIFSNFAGLNCTNNLEEVFAPFQQLLKPGGIVVLVMLPRFCLWELLMVFKGKFRTATRRFFAKRGRKAFINGLPFTCWYHSPRFVSALMKEDFDLIDREGLCTIVPPSYIEKFGEKYPRLFKFLCKKEDRLKKSWPWKNMGDYYIITFRKKRSI